jgi:ABC-type branched-subunit amino acid transport system substrate-binding protein
MTSLVLHPLETDPKKIAIAVRQLAEGRSNATGMVTLTANATSTTVTAPNCGPQSVVFLTPNTAHAAAVVASTYVSQVKIQQFTITHPSDSNADKTFAWVALG